MPYLEYRTLKGDTYQLSFDNSNHKDVMKLIRKLQRKINIVKKNTKSQEVQNEL